jgi:deoxyribonuclease-1-like protein
MRYILLVFFCLYVAGVQAQENCSREYTLTSWNIAHFGKSKSQETIEVIADIVKASDLVLVQEVSTGPAGAKTTSQLQEALSLTGARWDSLVSDATSGAGSERYATLWKSSRRIVVQRPGSLVRDVADTIDREPHEVSITIEGMPLKVYNFHAVPTKKNPIRELQTLAASLVFERVKNGFLVGDFNLSKVTVEGELGSKGWTAHIHGKTSLKQKLGRKGEYLLYQYDHILSKGSIKVTRSRVIDFVAERYSPITDESLRSARLVSDHLPVSVQFQVCRS